VFAAILGLTVASLAGWIDVPEAVAQEAASPSDLDLDGNGAEYWRGRVLDSRARLDAARKRHAAALTAYQNMRRHRHPRGEAATEIEAGFEAATLELEQSEAAVEALDEEARRAGAPPGWLRVESPDWQGDEDWQEDEE
jgi:hypothetical protein